MKQALLPQRRNLLLVQRDEIESQQAQQQRKAEKQQHKSLKQLQRQKLLQRPLVKLFGSLSSALWAVAVSLALTLSASYLVKHPYAFDALLRSFRQHLGISLAGALPAPPSATWQSNGRGAPDARQLSVRDASLQVERKMRADYLDDHDRIIEVLGRSRPQSVAGYVGVLTLRRVEVTPYIGIRSEQADRLVEFDQLPSNDVALLPTHQDFSLRCDQVFGAHRQVSLTAAEWYWQVDDYDEFGLPQCYSAQVVYRGEERWLDYTALLVTAHYEGQIFSEISSSGDQNRTITTLPVESSEPADNSDIEIIVNQAVPEIAANYPDDPSPDEARGGTSPWLPLALASLATTTAGASAAAVVYYKRRKKQQQAPTTEGEEDIHD
ncbi:MAG: hypothetical protein FWF11_02965 [Coriobacteriia bacterium]|nr:hypothetical protein [Coriobacteriia bacterium]